MQFEGSEKKFELVTSSSAQSFLDFDSGFWDSGFWDSGFWDMVANKAQATILSKVSNKNSIAFLLSESSLFVYEHRLIMITCGQTTLVDALLEVLKHVQLEYVDVLIYERKNEIFPAMQRTSFEEDSEAISRILRGKTIRLGQEDSFHVSIFYYDKPYAPPESDTTFELLMHDIAPEVSSCVRTEPTATSGLIQRDAVSRHIFGGFEVDDHCFEPCGYSLNAIRESYYYTFHITPENECSYASFETNYVLCANGLQSAVIDVLSVFRPKRFALVAFKDIVSVDVSDLGYQCELYQEERLHCGYTVHYMQNKLMARGA